MTAPPNYGGGPSDQNFPSQGAQLNYGGDNQGGGSRNFGQRGMRPRGQRRDPNQQGQSQGQDQGGASPTAGQRPTFAQMQANGQARPAPEQVAPQAYSSATLGGGDGIQTIGGGNPTGGEQTTGTGLREPNPNHNNPSGGTYGVGGSTGTVNGTGTGGTTAYVPGGAVNTNGTGATGNVSVNPWGSTSTNNGTYSTYSPSNMGWNPAQLTQSGNQLQSSVANALANPSRYDLKQTQQVRDALTGQLQQQFDAQRKQLDEEMARRGIGASSIASGYLGDLGTNQANAMANLNANLIQNAAQTYAADNAAALQAGQNLYGTNANLASQFGNLGLNAAQLNNQSQQFNQNLGQQLQIANMQDYRTGESNANNANLARLGLSLNIAQLLGLSNGSAGANALNNLNPAGGTQNSTPTSGTSGGGNSSGTGYDSPANDGNGSISNVTYAGNGAGGNAGGVSLAPVGGGTGVNTGGTATSGLGGGQVWSYNDPRTGALSQGSALPTGAIGMPSAALGSSVTQNSPTSWANNTASGTALNPFSGYVSPQGGGFGGYNPTYDNTAAANYAANGGTSGIDWSRVNPNDLLAMLSDESDSSNPNYYYGANGIKSKLASGQTLSPLQQAAASYFNGNSGLQSDFNPDGSRSFYAQLPGQGKVSLADYVKAMLAQGGSGVGDANLARNG